MNCLVCGRFMKKRGTHEWTCKCMPKSIVLGVGGKSRKVEKNETAM